MPQQLTSWNRSFTEQSAVSPNPATMVGTAFPTARTSLRYPLRYPLRYLLSQSSVLSAPTHPYQKSRAQHARRKMTDAHSRPGTTFVRTANQIQKPLNYASQSRNRNVTRPLTSAILSPFRQRRPRKTSTSAYRKPGTTYLQTARQMRNFLTNATRSRYRYATKPLTCAGHSSYTPQ